jgi:ADP-heptose:LPS heptosyltransferase
MRERSLSLEGPMPLGVLGAIIERAAVLVANNSGPAHMAAAVGTPVVCLYALTNPQHTPWRVASTVLSHEVPCRDCLRSVCPQGHHACLSEVAPAQVAQATLALLRHVRQSHLQEAS